MNYEQSLNHEDVFVANLKSESTKIYWSGLNGCDILVLVYSAEEKQEIGREIDTDNNHNDVRNNNNEWITNRPLYYCKVYGEDTEYSQYSVVVQFDVSSVNKRDVDWECGRFQNYGHR